jgi:very-short-patch-repair endonuclease
VVAAAGRQFDVISLEQLRGLGLSRGQIRGLVRQGMLYPIHPNVFVVGGPQPSRQGRMMAALLTCGPTSFLSHRAAASVWGVRVFNPYRIDVTVSATHPPARRGLAVHRTRSAEGITVSGKLRVSSYSRMLIELAAAETTKELERLLTQGLRRNLLRLDAMEEALASHPRYPGLAKLKHVLADYRPKPDRKSNLERAFDALIAATNIPEPQRNVIIDGWELDCYWPDYGVAVELDGRPYHLTVADLEKDKYKDTKLALLGIQVIRITGHRLETEPQAVLADVCALLALRAPVEPLTAAHPASTMPGSRPRPRRSSGTDGNAP